MSVVISSTLLPMRNALNYFLFPVWPGRRARWRLASIALFALVVQSYAWASQPCHTIQHAQHSEMADHSHDQMSGHAGYSDPRVEPHDMHDMQGMHDTHDTHDMQFDSVLALAHSCPACSACCLAAAVFDSSGASGLLDLRDPGPPVTVVLAQPSPPHDPPFHPPRFISFL